jgi:hypothetical protein
MELGKFQGAGLHNIQPFNAPSENPRRVDLRGVSRI